MIKVKCRILSVFIFHEYVRRDIVLSSYALVFNALISRIQPDLRFLSALSDVGHLALDSVNTFECVLCADGALLLVVNFRAHNAHILRFKKGGGLASMC